MDPVGLSLEKFDAIGRRRSAEGGQAIDASGSLPDGSELADVRGLEEALLRRPELFIGTLSEKLLTYALGRGVDYRDMPAVRKIARDAPSRFRGDTFLLNVGADTPAGRLTAYHYALDLDDGEGGPLSEVNSSVTSGLSLAGRRFWKDIGLGWRIEYARQDDYAGNPVDYSAEYWRAVGTLDVADVSVTGGHETLGEGGARAFQTPLGTNHAFQGAADMFVVTPVVGVRDSYVDAVWSIGAVGPVRGLTAGLRRHWFADDIVGDDLGSEWDASLRGTVNGVQASLDFAAYSADGFGVDTQKLWVTIRRGF
jgi:hypothetical protein